MVIGETTGAKTSQRDIAAGQRERRLPVTLFRIFLWVFFKVFYRARWLHYDRVPRSGPVILAPSHACFYDPPFVNVPIWRRCHFFTRDYYFKFPLGPIIRYLGAFPVDLTRRLDSRAYDLARRLLENGGMLIVFPEGTRTSDGLLGEIRPGVAALALDTGATIVPISIGGAFEVWPRTRSSPRFCRRMWVKYHRPIAVERTTDPITRRQKIAEIADQLRRVLAPRLRAWQRLLQKRNVRGGRRATDKPTT